MGGVCIEVVQLFPLLLHPSTTPFIPFPSPPIVTVGSGTQNEMVEEDGEKYRHGGWNVGVSDRKLKFLEPQSIDLSLGEAAMRKPTPPQPCPSRSSFDLLYTSNKQASVLQKQKSQEFKREESGGGGTEKALIIPPKRCCVHLKVL